MEGEGDCSTNVVWVFETLTYTNCVNSTKSRKASPTEMKKYKCQYLWNSADVYV